MCPLRSEDYKKYLESFQLRLLLHAVYASDSPAMAQDAPVSHRQPKSHAASSVEHPAKAVRSHAGKVMQRPCSNQRVMQRKSLAHNGAGARPAPLLVRLLFLRAAADPHVRCRAMPLAREPVISPPVRDCVCARVCAACGRRLAPSVSQRLEPDAVVAVHHNWSKAIGTSGLVRLKPARLL